MILLSCSSPSACQAEWLYVFVAQDGPAAAPPRPHLSDVALGAPVGRLHDAAHDGGVAAHHQRLVGGVRVDAHPTVTRHGVRRRPALPKAVAVHLELARIGSLRARETEGAREENRKPPEGVAAAPKRALTRTMSLSDTRAARRKDDDSSLSSWSLTAAYKPTTTWKYLRTRRQHTNKTQRGPTRG